MFFGRAVNVTPNRTNEKISDTPLNDDICQRRSFRVRPKSSKNGSKIFVPNRPMQMKRPSSSGAIMQTPIYFPEMVMAKDVNSDLENTSSAEMLHKVGELDGYLTSPGVCFSKTPRPSTVFSQRVGSIPGTSQPPLIKQIHHVAPQRSVKPSKTSVKSLIRPEYFAANQTQPTSDSKIAVIRQQSPHLHRYKPKVNGTVVEHLQVACIRANDHECKHCGYVFRLSDLTDISIGQSLQNHSKNDAKSASITTIDGPNHVKIKELFCDNSLCNTCHVLEEAIRASEETTRALQNLLQFHKQQKLGSKKVEINRIRDERSSHCLNIDSGEKACDCHDMPEAILVRLCGKMATVDRAVASLID